MEDEFAHREILDSLGDQRKRYVGARSSLADRWKRATRGKDRALDADTERLKRPPRGFDPNHPLIEDLKLKGFIRSGRFTQKQACAPDFLNEYARACKRAGPLMEFLATAVGLKW